MTTPTGETRIDEIELAIKRIDSRLENSETKNTTTAQRLDELYQALLERLNAKDDTLARVKELSEWALRQNDTLLKQIGLRWNLLTGLTTFVALAFTAVFTYQIWRVEQVMQTKTALDVAAAAAEANTKLLSQNTKAYSDILSILAHADALMTESNREFLRAEYTVAEKRAGDAIGTLKLALQSTGDNFTELENRTLFYAATTCSLNPSQSAAPKDKMPADSVLSPNSLQPAVRDALFTAYDLHGRGAFFSTPRGDLRADGVILLALNDSRWEGYHWIGLAAEDAGLVSEATECFRHSVDKNQVGNKDYLNLAELSFTHSNFADAVKYSEQYLHPLNHRFKSSLDVVGQFYFTAAGFLAPDAVPHDKMSPDTFRANVIKLPDFSLEGTFSPDDLNKYLSSEEFSEKVTADQKKQVNGLVNCLTFRQCKD
jgi:hypothetical protein